ncbi:ABC transporter permease subunit [Glaciihabitans sp. dw_435]|uniref:ABC transporter permease subunit n=1 Tax=Glaciihabitans sp. dw_435 TaxID=2720081 RepID=UPI001BD4776D|nr:ABC transporter permease subunit [Glaciihabitans sp. dw_435]
MTTVTARDSATLSTLTFGGVLRSEWIKLRTLRSTVWCFQILAFLTLAVGVLVALNTGEEGAPQAVQQNIVLQASTAAISFSQLVACVLGVLVISGEYGTGMIRSTLTAVPRRLPALYAKVIVFGVVTFVVAAVSILVTSLLAAALLAPSGVYPDLGDGDYWLALVGGATYLALLGVMALAIGAIIRNSAGGIAAALGLVLVLPGVIQLIGVLIDAKWLQNVAFFLPDQAGRKMFSYGAPNSVTDGIVSLGNWQGGLVLVGWVVVLLVLASVLLKRRDV